MWSTKMNHHFLYSPINASLVYLILVAMPIFANQTTRPIEATGVHHVIMKRQTPSSPQAPSHPNEHGNYEIPSNDSEHDSQHEYSIRPSVIAPKISHENNSTEASSLRSIQISKQATPAPSKSQVQSSKVNYSTANFSNFSTIVKSSLKSSNSHHHHHHHNHSHRHHHQPTEKVHELNNHHHHDHKQEKNQGHDNQHHHQHHHHHHHHNHNKQNDHHEEKVGRHNFSVLESLRSTKNPIQAFKTKSLTMTSIISTNPAMIKLMNITSKTLAVQTSRSISPMETFITGRSRYSTVQGKTSAEQHTTTISHHSIISRPTMKSTKTQPVTFSITESETSENNSAITSSRLKLTGKNVTSTLKPTDKIITMLTSRPTDNVNISSTLKPTNSVDVSSTSKTAVKNTKLSTLKLTRKINISSTYQVNTLPSTNTMSIQKRVEGADNSSTSNPKGKPHVLSTLMPTNKIVTKLKLNLTDEIARSVNETIHLPTLQESNMTKTVNGIKPTVKSSDAYISISGVNNNTTNSTAIKTIVKEVKMANVTQKKDLTSTISSQTYLHQKESSPNALHIVLTSAKLNATTVEYSEKKQTNATNGISTSLRQFTRKPVDGENETFVSKINKMNSTILTYLPLTKYFVAAQNTSAIFENTTHSPLDLDPQNNSGSVITENNIPHSSTQKKSFPLSVEYTTNPLFIRDENTLSSYNKTNGTNSSIFSMNEPSQSTQQLENTENYIPDLDQNNISDPSVRQTTLDDLKLTNDTHIFLSETKATNVESTTLNIITTQGSSTSKRSRGSRSPRTYTSSIASSTYTDDWQSDTTIQENLNSNNLGSERSYSSDTNNWMSTDNYQDWDTTTQQLNYDQTTTNTYSDYNGGYSAQSSYSYGNNDAYNYDDVTTSISTNYDDDDYGMQKSSGYNYGNKNDDDYDTYYTQSTSKSYASDYDETYGTSTQSTYVVGYDNEYNSNSKSTYRSYNSDYNNIYDQSTLSTYTTNTPYYDENYDLSPQSTYNQYTSDYDNSYDLSMQSSNRYDDFTSKDIFDSADDNDDYDTNSKTVYDSYSSHSTQTQMNPWQGAFNYTSSSSPTEHEFDLDEVTETSKSEVIQSATQNLGTVSITTKSPYYMNTDYYVNLTQKKRSKKRWYGYTNTIALNTTTTPYTGPSTRRRETIIHETVTRFMPGGVKYRYSKIHWDDSNCEIFNPWSHPPDLSTLFDYYKFRRVYYSKSKTFWEDIKHYFIKFVRIFKKDFRKDFDPDIEIDVFKI